MSTNHDFLDMNGYFTEPTPPRTVYTYFEQDPALPGFHEILLLWEENWRAQGWIPVVLTDRNAMDHPNYDALRDHVESLPTVNPHVYEAACFMRWAALAAGDEPGFMVDFDVFNFGFRPEHLTLGYPHLMLHPYRVPCALFTAKPDELVSMILDYSDKDAITVQGHPHCSDQEMMRLPRNKDRFAIQPECMEYRLPGWTTSPLVHFSNAALAAAGKIKADIPDLLVERAGV